MADIKDPQKLTDDIAKQENAEDLSSLNKYIVDPAKKAGRRLYENIMGTPEQNKAAQERMDKSRGKKAGGIISKAVMQKAGFYDKGKTKSERQKIVSKATTKPQRVAIVEKMFSTKNMKAGGAVSSASKRADGCAVKGKTKGRVL